MFPGGHLVQALRIWVEKQLLTDTEFGYVGEGKADHKQWLRAEWRNRVRSYSSYQGEAGKYSHF